MKVTLKVVLSVVFCFLMISWACPGNGGADNKEVKKGVVESKEVFSFIAAGDSRTEVYLTGGKAQEQAMRDVIFESYGLQSIVDRMGGRVTAEMIKGGYDLDFDPQTGKLHSVKSPVETGEPNKYRCIDFYRDGWPVLRRTINDAQQMTTVIMRDTGRKWVNSRITWAMNKGAQFLIHGGDFIMDGTLGQTLDENPYYQLFYKELAAKIQHLAPLRIGNILLEGRIFGVIGNHETYRDPDAKGFFTLLPWLTELGMNNSNWTYSFVYGNCYFIFLDSGPTSKPVWDSTRPVFETQMDFLTSKLNEAKAKKAQHVFVTYHKPSFVKVGHGPLQGDNPHTYLKKFANELKIYVFNSHCHTTEQYLVDGVNYFVLGGGGATQNLEMSKHPSPEPELYWKDQPRVEEYNYMEVKIDGANIECLIHRIRPTDTKQPVKVIKVL